MKWNEEITISAERATYGVARDFEREVGALVWRGTPREFWDRFPSLLPDFGRYGIDHADESREMADVPLLALHTAFVAAAVSAPCERRSYCQEPCVYCDALRRLTAGIVWAAGSLVDGTRVSYSSGWPTNCATYWLIAPAKQGTLAIVDWDQDPQFDRNPRLSEWFSRAEAQEQARKDREQRRVAQATYEAARQGAGDILRAGGGLIWHLGQEGGTVEFDGVRVSARGAMVAAGMPRDTIDQWWNLISEIERREERMPRLSTDEWFIPRRPGTWTLYAAGAVYRVMDGTVYVLGRCMTSVEVCEVIAESEALHFATMPRQTGIRDPRAGKRGDHRAERRATRLEIAAWL